MRVRIITRVRVIIGGHESQDHNKSQNHNGRHKRHDLYARIILERHGSHIVIVMIIKEGHEIICTLSHFCACSFIIIIIIRRACQSGP